MWLKTLYILLTVHLITIFVNNQHETQFFFLYLFTPIPIDTIQSREDKHLVARNM